MPSRTTPSDRRHYRGLLGLHRDPTPTSSRSRSARQLRCRCHARRFEYSRLLRGHHAQRTVRLHFLNLRTAFRASEICSKCPPVLPVSHPGACRAILCWPTDARAESRCSAPRGRSPTSFPHAQRREPRGAQLLARSHLRPQVRRHRRLPLCVTTSPNPQEPGSIWQTNRWATNLGSALLGNGTARMRTPRWQRVAVTREPRPFRHSAEQMGDHA